MKIKQVCELTGLTDRAIRYYIEEGLLSPAYTENYMGRRAYDFTEADVAALNHVATLRKFGFTVEEIRRILTDPQESVGIHAEVRARKEETLRQEGENLDALSRLESERAYTVAELAERLAEPVREVSLPKEDGRKAWRALAGRIAWAAVLLVVGAAIIAVGADLLVEHGQIIAIGLGVPETVVALLFVALGTSLPELVTTITSLKKGRASLGVGNVIGANVFNLVLVSGVAVSLAPFPVPCENFLLDTGLNMSLVFEIPVMLGVMSLMIFPTLASKKLARWQGLLLLGIYIAFCVCQFVL